MSIEEEMCWISSTAPKKWKLQRRTHRKKGCRPSWKIPVIGISLRKFYSQPFFFSFSKWVFLRKGLQYIVNYLLRRKNKIQRNFSKTSSWKLKQLVIRRRREEKKKKPPSFSFSFLEANRFWNGKGVTIVRIYRILDFTRPHNIDRIPIAKMNNEIMPFSGKCKIHTVQIYKKKYPTLFGWQSGNFSPRITNILVINTKLFLVFAPKCQTLHLIGVWQHNNLK